ncbi:MAG TPA: hypothetical protein VLV82_07375 [Candidatus Angelobacter sp.]|nr:hypothetical protein [Candidatus Angelobacter sp.]
MRIYLPTTVAGLAALHCTGRLTPAPLSAHAVTPALRRSWPEADEEELEYAVLMAAAYDSLTLIAATSGEPRRVVVVADVEDNVVTATASPEDPTTVSVGAEVPISRCTAVQVDDADAEGEIVLALGRLDAAVAGDERALADVSLVELELMWFATQEIPDLLR